jgi:hypothetical protein
MGDPTVDGDPFEVIAESFLARFRAGERPGVEEHAALYPELADQIRRLLPALVIVEQDQSIDLDSVRAARSPPWSYRPARSGGSATTVSSGKSRGAVIVALPTMELLITPGQHSGHEGACLRLAAVAMPEDLIETRAAP